MWGSMSVRADAHGGQNRVSDFSGAGVTGGFKPANVSAGI